MAITSPRTPQEQAFVEAAREGDQEAFRQLAEQYRPELLAHCYRMLGSMHDAEDALQETMLRAWRGLPRFESRSSLRTWLYQIATNFCLDAIEGRRRRALPIDHGPPSEPRDDPGAPLVESVWVEPYPSDVLALPEGQAAPDARYEQQEAVELAFIAALQHLPATQRAVLLLRDVLGFSAREVSEWFDTTIASVNSSLQRARKTVDERLPEQSQQATLRSLGDERIRKLVEGYLVAWRNGDVDSLRALLTRDAVFSMPPWSSWWRGRDTIAGFAKTAVEECGETRSIPTRANAQLAIAYYHLDDATGRFTASALDVLTVAGPEIKDITAFVTPEIFPSFDLPTELTA